MNTHEIDRISAAMNMLRPDWPKQQLRTLLADERITDRPRRDVCVALAWVACEPNSHTPYRVLEAGPWWKAAGIEGGNGKPGRKYDPHDTCSICSYGPDVCAQQFGDDHKFFSVEEARTIRLNGDQAHERVERLRASIEPTAGPTSTRTLDDLAEANPELHARVDALREANPGLDSPPLHEPAPPTPPQPSGATASETEPQEVPA